MSEGEAPADGGQGGNEAPAAAPQGEAPEATQATGEPTTAVPAFEDAELGEWVKAKFNGAEPTIEKLAGSYRNLEKIVGADKAGRTLTIPGPDAEPDEVASVFAKLGKPEKPDGYELPVPEGDDGKMAEWARGVFHEANLTSKQAQAVAEKWNEYIGSMRQNAEQDNQVRAADAERELRQEWGAAYDQKVNGIDQAAAQLGLKPEELNGLRNSMGPVAAMKFVDGLAGKLGERPVDRAGESDGGALTPMMAQSELQRLGTDKEFMDAWMNKNHPSHKWAVEKKQRIAKMAAGHGA